MPIGAGLNQPAAKGELLERSLITLRTVLAVRIVLWLLGIVTSYAIGGLIHTLLVIAIIVVLLNVIQGRRNVLV